jgi:hypothetical protein
MNRRITGRIPKEVSHYQRRGQRSIEHSMKKKKKKL